MIDLSKLVPVIHHPAWSSWARGAHRTLNGSVVGTCAPVYGLTAASDGEPLTSDELAALGDPDALEARAIANLDALPYVFEVTETTKGFLGFGKQPLALTVRGRLAAERVLSTAFLAAARARLGGASRIAIGMPDRETLHVRNHDAPHFGSAFEFATRVRTEYATPGRVSLCNGTMIAGASGIERGYVRAPEPSPPYPFPARELSELRLSKDGTVANTPASELESMPELQPDLGPLVQLLGRHRTQHHLEVAIDATTSAALGDAGRAALARMALAVPGTLVKPITGVRILVPSGAELGDLEWSLRHPHVAIYVPGPKAGTLQIHRGPSVRAATDNLTKSLAELAALG